MKLLNLFKKENKIVAKATIETLAKNQLAKVIGGADGDTTIGDAAGVLKTKHDTAKNSVSNIR